MSNPAPANVVNALVHARQHRQLADAAPVQATLQTADDAYAAQNGVAQAMGWFGDAPPFCWKSGGASAEALSHAPLPPEGVWNSPAVAGDWPFTLRGIEAEIALRLALPVNAALAASLDAEKARQLVDAMAVAIEVVDSRWQQGLDAPTLCKQADLLCHGALVLGEWVPFEARDWSRQSGSVHIGTQTHTFTGGHSLNDPTLVLVGWLRHATREGATLPAGTVVTTGTWCGLLHARAGDAVVAAFDGVGEARVLL